MKKKLDFLGFSKHMVFLRRRSWIVWDYRNLVIRRKKKLDFLGFTNLVFLRRRRIGLSSGSENSVFLRRRNWIVWGSQT